MHRHRLQFTGGRLAIAMLLLIACSIPAWAQTSVRAGDDLGGALPDGPIRQRVFLNDASVRLYGTLDAGNNSSQIFKILNDGTYVTLGPVLQGIDLEGMDVSPITGDMYAVVASGAFAGNLYKIDKNTGAATLIGSTGLTELISASFHPVTGEFWVYKHLSGLYTINLTTAVPTFKFTPVGTTVYKTWEGLAWDNTGTYLYGQNRNFLYRWDPVSHQTAIICSALSPSGEGLDFAPDGTLFAGLDPNDPAPLRLFTIDLNTCAMSPSGLNLPLGDIESIAFENVVPSCTGSIGDFVWNDANGNGIQDVGESGFAGVTVTLRTGAGAFISSTTTNASGLYAFNGLCAGDYKVEVDETTLPPGGYAPSPCHVGSDNTIDNNCSPALVNLPTDSSTDTTIDFGYTCGCSDTDACTSDACQGTQGCVHTPINCDDQNVCTTDTCDSATGCVHTPINVEDGDLCTVDTCDPADGVHHDPLNCDNGNACNLDTCDPASGCVHTVIDCDDHDKCTNDSCDPATGCVHETVSCDDHNACSDDACDSASGCSHTLHVCNDGSVCTNDSCDPATGCVFTEVDCDDQNACTTDSCDPASGCHHSAGSCDDGDPCTVDSCDRATGCSHTPLTIDDGNACTTDSCDEAGVHHTPISCDDGNSCTNDSCDPATGCVHEAPGCDDGNACTTDSCTTDGGCTHEPVVCNDGDACTADSCDQASGCVYSAITCDDHNSCTTDACDPETGCTSAPTVCNDDDPCTSDSCDPASGCVYTPISPAPEGCGPVLTSCRITGGGINALNLTDPSIDAENTKGTFGGQVGSPIGHIGCFDDFDNIQGSWTYHRHRNKGSFHAMDYNSLVCGCDGVMDGKLCNPGDREQGPEPRRAPANMACFNGVGDYNPSNGRRHIRVAFRIEVEDRGEPGAGANAGTLDDVHKIRIWIPKVGETADDLAQAACCTIPNANLTIRTPDINEGGDLIHGNIQIHPGHPR